MGISAIIGAIGVGVSAAGVVLNHQASKKNAEQQAEFQNQALAEQQKQEKLRKQQLDLDAMRRKRAALRDMLTARATANAVGTNQGAGFSSALPGAYGGISGAGGGNILAVGQNQELGGEMFASNARLSGIYRNAAVASANASSDMALFSGMTSLGGMAVNNAQTLDKVGTWLGSRFSTSDGYAD